jgi:transposase InsO family protein
VQRLQSLGVSISMAAVGEAQQNGYAERLMRTIKEEEVYLSEYLDFDDARRNIARFIDNVYNVKRIHSSLGYLTPREYELQWWTEHPPTTTTRT